MTVITSLQNPAIKLISSLAEKKNRRESGLFVAEGVAMLERALAQGWVPQQFVATKPIPMWDEVKPLIVSAKVMAELSAQNNPQDALAVFKRRFETHPKKEGIWLALEEIHDPGNLGSIIRTADAAGAAGVILAGDCCDAYSPECVRATTGSIFAMPLVKMPVASLVDLMKAWPGEVVGTAMAANADYRRAYPEPLLLLLGSEARGLSGVVSSACKRLVRIPMRAGTESLNVAAAAALMLYEAARNRPKV